MFLEGNKMKENKLEKETLVTVIGNGHVNVPNDKVDVEINFRKEAKTIEDSCQAVLSKIDNLKNIIAIADYNPTKFTSGNLNISPKTKQIKNDDGTYTWVRDGFEASSNCQLTFPIGKKGNWAKAVDSIISSLSDCSINIFFGYEDEKEVKQRLLERAVKNALDKINDIAESASQKLDYIVSIEEISDFDSAARPMALSMRSSVSSLEPSESQASASVKVVASLKAK